MNTERENIFSWRETLRQIMTPQERVDFYYGKLKEGYQKSVGEAEKARQEARRPNDPHDQEIQEIFQVWASEETQRRLNAALERRRKKGLNVDGGQKTIDLGLAGHFRIKQVHETTMAGKTWLFQWLERQRRLKAARRVFDRWPSVKRTTSETPYTIHGNPIDWELEVVQDEVKYWHTAGKRKKAAEIAQKGISLAFRKISRWLLENLPERSDLVAANIDLYLEEIKNLVDAEKFQTLIGFLSAKAVLEYRKGLATRDLEPLIGALRDISAVQEQIPNNHRFATINWKVLFASLTYKGNFSLRERINYFGKAAKNLWEVGKKDPKSVFRSFLQMF